MAPLSKKQHYSTQVLDAFIWEKIVRFLAVRKQISINAGEVLRTVGSLRLVSRELAEYFHPTKQDFWRRTMLLCFDFTSTTEDEFDEPLVEDKFAEQTLQECFALWPALNVHFRPSQYQFLAEIQSGRLSMASWPEHEDSFSLFTDLVLASESFQQFEGTLEAKSEGESFLDPVLLSAIPADADWDPEGVESITVSLRPGPEGHIPYHPLFVQCGFLLEFWAQSSWPVSLRWVGFCAQDAQQGVVNDLYSEEDKEWQQYPDHDTVYLNDVPKGKIGEVKMLVELIKTRFSDWRMVTSAFDLEGAPVFYVGRSLLSERWMGFVGHCQYHRRSRHTIKGCPW